MSYVGQIYNKCVTLPLFFGKNTSIRGPYAKKSTRATIFSFNTVALVVYGLPYGFYWSSSTLSSPNVMLWCSWSIVMVALKVGMSSPN